MELEFQIISLAVSLIFTEYLDFVVVIAQQVSSPQNTPHFTTFPKSIGP